MLPILDAIGLEMIVFNFIAGVILFIVAGVCVPLLIWSIIKIRRSNKKKGAKKE